MKHIQQFPHCDPRILHDPKDNCQFCNEHEDWQELRKYWGIAFTGHSYDKDGKLTMDEYGNFTLPCPAEFTRGMESINGWHGNVAFTPEVKEASERELDKINDTVKKFYDNLPKDES
jgi:hypothetical protein